MRILLTETETGDSARVERTARLRGVEVARCQPTIGQVTPCLSLCRGTPCPLEKHIDAVIDVRRHGSPRLSGRELGTVCAMRVGIPIVVVGDNPLGAAATESTEDDAVEEAIALANVGRDRPSIRQISRQVQAELGELHSTARLTWVGYVDSLGGFDVIIELSHPVTVQARERLDLALMPLFWQAITNGRFGRLIYESRSPGI